MLQGMNPSVLLLLLFLFVPAYAIDPIVNPFKTPTEPKREALRELWVLEDAMATARPETKVELERMVRAKRIAITQANGNGLADDFVVKLTASLARARQMWPMFFSGALKKDFDAALSAAMENPEWSKVWASPEWPELFAGQFARSKGLAQ